MDYLDFDLDIRQAEGNDYVVTVHSPAGEAEAPLVFPYDKLALENRLKDLEIAVLSARGGHRQVLQPAAQRAQRFGAELFKLLLQDNILSRYDTSLVIAQQQKKGLRLRLCIDAPVLAALPWEFLYDARRGDPVCLSHDTPLVRYLRLAHPLTPLQVTPPLRILAMAVSPSDLPPLDLRVERQRMDSALHTLQERGLVEVVWLQRQTWSDLRNALLDAGPWHVFHFVGHGGFDSSRDEGTLILADADGRAQSQTATNVGHLLADHTSLRLVLLNACEGAKGGEYDIFSSTAATLVRRGIPAVVAMQYPISDAAAIQFAQAFYERLAAGMPVDGAVAEARLAILFESANSLEWGTPVLYTHAADGRIFDMTMPAVTVAAESTGAARQEKRIAHEEIEEQKRATKPGRSRQLHRYWFMAGAILLLCVIGFGSYRLWPTPNEPTVSPTAEEVPAQAVVAATETQPPPVATTPAPVTVVATATAAAHLTDDSATPATVTETPSSTPPPTTLAPATSTTAPPTAAIVVAVATPTNTPGCAGITPIPPATMPVWAAWQPFQTGQMLWLVHTDDAYLFFDKSGCWQVSAHHWDGRDYAQRWPTPASTELHVPEQGFGYLWNANETIYNDFGDATQIQKGFCAEVKTMPGGVLITSVAVDSCAGDEGNPNTAREGTWKPLALYAYNDGTWE
ncbi:MAG: CHAT domain-containing protein [Caldilineaceae bacterium]